MRQEEIDITTKLLIFQATSFCNIYCKYCDLPNRNIKDRLTSTVAKQTIVRMMEAKLLGERLNILFHDGEPTVLPITEYEDIIKAISDTTDANISYDMQTNGTLINQNWCEFFLKKISSKKSMIKSTCTLAGGNGRDRSQTCLYGEQENILVGAENFLP